MGAMGAATLAALSDSGLKILGIDQFSPPHDQGSSHGETRLLRTAYAEDEAYVPLVKRAIELWRRYEALTGDVLFDQTGVVYAAREPSELLTSIRTASVMHNVPIETISPAERPGFMPQLSVPDDWTVIYEPDGGFVHAERTISAMLGVALNRGVMLIQNASVQMISRDGSAYRIATPERDYHAEKLMLCAGAWITNLVPELSEHIHLQRRVLHWFHCAPDSFTQASGFKPFCVADSDRWIYGFPDVTGGQIKVADHHASEDLEAIEVINRDTADEDFSALADIVERAFPTLGPMAASKVCVYTMSPDEHFILGECPGREGVYIVTGFSGHGFKFAPAIGELMASMITDASFQLPYPMLSIDRYFN